MRLIIKGMQFDLLRLSPLRLSPYGLEPGHVALAATQVEYDGATPAVVMFAEGEEAEMKRLRGALTVRRQEDASYEYDPEAKTLTRKREGVA